MRRTLLLTTAASIAAVALVSCRTPASIETYPSRNILILSVDTLRADHLASYGYSRVTSPTIDALAKRGITFDLAFAPRGSTWPSLATMLTSLSPPTSNVRENGQYLSPNTPTIAELLRDAGYNARAFVSGSICHMTRRITAFERVACGEDTYVTTQAVEFLRERGDQPFFAWVHLIAPHAPYQPPAEHDTFSLPDYQGPVGRGDQDSLGTLIRAQKPLTDADRAQLYGLYDGEIGFADAQLARILQVLDEKGLRDDTIVAFLSDHGEELGDHNGYLYHSCSVYDSVLRIPMMLVLPDDASAGRRFASIVEIQDLAPTLLELVGVPRLPTFEGRSLLPRLNSRENEEERFAPSEWYETSVGKTIQTLRTERWRYVSNPHGITPRCPPKGDYYRIAREELYDHETDPLDQRNVAAEHPELMQRFAKLTEGAEAISLGVKPQEIDKNLYEELRSFGYVE